MDTKTFIQKIINIGKNQSASDNQVRELLPEYPTLRGSENLFKIGWANAERYLDEYFVDFVKGLLAAASKLIIFAAHRLVVH